MITAQVTLNLFLGLDNGRSKSCGTWGKGWASRIEMFRPRWELWKRLSNKYGWWLNHPFEKYAQVKMISSSPRIGVKIPKIFELPPPSKCLYWQIHKKLWKSPWCHDKIRPGFDQNKHLQKKQLSLTTTTLNKKWSSTLRIIGPSKLAILRTLPLLYRFKPFHWRVQDP